MKSAAVVALMVSLLVITGCVQKLVTVPVGIAYKTTKAVVVGTGKAVGALIPDGDGRKK